MSSSRRESRFVANPFADYDGNESMLSSSNRSLLREDIAQTIMDGAFTLFNYWEEHSRGEYNGNDVSVYTGVTGDALLYLKLAESPPHITSCSSTALLERAINRVNEAMKRMRSKANPIPSFICGEVGLLAVAALAAHKQLQDNSFVDRYLRTIAKERAAVVDLEGAAKELPDELLYGRAGYLYTLLFLRKELSELPSTSTIISDELIRSVVMAILNSGIRTARKHPEIGSPLVYFWHDSQYVGAAHGYTGIAYLLLEAKAHLTEIELNGLVRPMIDFICRLRFPETGNFPSSFGEDKTDKLVHWCHGSPGVIHLLGLASKTFPDGQNYLEIAIQGGNDIWRRGLLKKGKCQAKVLFVYYLLNQNLL